MKLKNTGIMESILEYSSLNLPVSLILHKRDSKKDL